MHIKLKIITMNYLMKTMCLFTLILSSGILLSQEKHNLSGYVRDSANGEELIGATVSTADFEVIVSTNVYGFYSISLTAGTYEIAYSFIGYNELKKTITVSENFTLDIELTSSSVNISEALVTGESENKN